MKVDKKNTTIKIGDLLRRTRKSLGYTQEDVAERLDLASRYVSDIERNKTKGSIDTLVKLCNIYHITPTYVLQEYLELKDEFKIDPDLIGFYKLDRREQEVVLALIQYMNITKNKVIRKSLYFFLLVNLVYGCGSSSTSYYIFL